MPISQPVYTNTLSCPPLLDPPPLPLLLLLLLPAVPHVLRWTARSLRDSLLKLFPLDDTIYL